VSLDVEALKRLNAAVFTAVEEREELRRQVRVARQTLADFAAIDRERIALQRRVRRLEAALRQIAACQPNAPGDVVHVARAALVATTESRETPPAPPPLDPQEAWPLYREGGRSDGLG